MFRRTRRLLITTLAAGLVLSTGSTALAAPVGTLKQFKVPTTNSQPRAITNGADGNVWFTEGTDFTNAPPKVGRVTPSGAVTEFAIDCNSCILTDIDQGPDGVLYMTSNNPILVRFDVDTLTQLPSIDIPNTGSASEIDVAGNEVWLTADFDSLVRYDITGAQFTEFPLGKQPADVLIDAGGNPWFTSPNDQTIDRLNPSTGAIAASFAVPDGLTPRSLTIAADGQFWFTSRFVPQGVGRLNTATGVVTTFPTPSNPGPEGIAASPNGTVWFTQTTRGNIASIDNSGVITETKAVKGSETLGITVAANGNPWFTMLSADKIGTFQLR